MLGDHLKELRNRSHSGQAEIASHLNITREAYAMYETGRRQPQLETLVRLADLYKVSVDYLLDRRETPEIPPVLSNDEKQLLEVFRSLDTRGRSTLLRLAAVEISLCSGSRQNNTPIN